VALGVGSAIAAMPTAFADDPESARSSGTNSQDSSASASADSPATSRTPAGRAVRGRQVDRAMTSSTDDALAPTAAAPRRHNSGPTPLTSANPEPIPVVVPATAPQAAAASGSVDALGANPLSVLESDSGVKLTAYRPCLPG
jgi:hypothetical protein